MACDLVRLISILLLRQVDKMPFDGEGFYYHDFDNLPTIVEEDEPEETEQVEQQGGDTVASSTFPKDPPPLKSNKQLEFHQASQNAVPAQIPRDSKHRDEIVELPNAAEAQLAMKPLFAATQRARRPFFSRLGRTWSARDNTDDESRRRLNWCSFFQRHSRSGSAQRPEPV